MIRSPSQQWRMKGQLVEEPIAELPVAFCVRIETSTCKRPSAKEVQNATEMDKDERLGHVLLRVIAVLSRKCWWRYRCDSSPSVTIQYNGMNRLRNSIRTLFIDWLSHTLEFVLKLLKMYHLCNLNYIASMPLQTSSFQQRNVASHFKNPKEGQTSTSQQSKHDVLIFVAQKVI